MQHIRAIGFDLFDTLVTLQNLGYHEAMDRLVNGLRSQDIIVEQDVFLPIYREAARTSMERARREHKETHNRYWISAALGQVGYDISPDDPRILRTVDSYFSAFLDHATLLPNTLEMLESLKHRYRLGLLSNFTHAPAVHKILDRFGLDAYFEVRLVSGELGYRKPHNHVFDTLSEELGVSAHEIAYVGDDYQADIGGAREAGLVPIHTTYARAYKATLTSDVPERPGDNPDPPIWRRRPAQDAASVEAGQDASASEVHTIASWDELLVLFDIG